MDFDNKLLSFNERFNSIKAKYVLVQNELNELTKKVKLSTKAYRSSFSRKIIFYKR